MPKMKKLGEQIHSALMLDVPAELVALVVTSSNPKRMQEMFQQASQRLLRAHQEVLQRPASALAIHRRARSKALLDLVRARMAATGARKPSVVKMLALLDSYRPQNVVAIRKVA
jgi:hypothetical protein